MKFMLIRLIMAVIWIFAAYIWGDWKDWKKYYPTMLFFAIGCLIYELVFYNKRLWAFQSDYLVPALNNLLIIFTIFFASTLLFISNFPKVLSHQILYMSFWIVLYVCIEIFTTSIGMQKNYNGWNIYWSFLHNCIQFPLLILHYRHPVLAWVVAFIFLAIVMNIFGVPFLINT